MFLNSDSLQVEVITSKSSEMNIMVPKGHEGDYVSKKFNFHNHLQQAKDFS